MKQMLAAEENSSFTEKQFIELAAQAGQHVLLKHFQTLDAERKKALIESVTPYCVPQTSLVSYANQPEKITPFPPKNIFSLTEEEKKTYWTKGLEQIANEKVAVLTFAGGCSTRLGGTTPKSMFNIGMPSGKPIIQFLAEKLLAVTLLASTDQRKPQHPFWIITTSERTEKCLPELFESKNYFGLDRNRVRFLCQTHIPCYDVHGNILLQSETKPLITPNGNGGLYDYLGDSDVLAMLHSRHTEHIQIINCDNPFLLPADPTLLGFAEEHKSELCIKVLEKTEPHEKVGVFGIRDGKLGVIEYSDMNRELEEKKGENGRLLFQCANINIFCLRLDFLSMLCAKTKTGELVLPYHSALKREEYFDTETRVTAKPLKDCIVKMEKFVFDAFHLSQKTDLVFADRDEFCPVKDLAAAEKARMQMHRLHHAWLEQTSRQILHSSSESCCCEVPSLLSLQSADQSSAGSTAQHTVSAE